MRALLTLTLLLAVVPSIAAADPVFLTCENNGDNELTLHSVTFDYGERKAWLELEGEGRRDVADRPIERLTDSEITIGDDSNGARFSRTTGVAQLWGRRNGAIVNNHYTCKPAEVMF